MKTNRGFTLIELLVVIAIIGILSGVVLTSLGVARTKSKRAVIKSEFVQLRTQMELSFINGKYGATNGRVKVSPDGSITISPYSTSAQACNNDKILEILKNIAKNSSKDVYCTVGFSSGTWAIITGPLTSVGTTGYQCIDSSNNNQVIPTLIITSYTYTQPVKCK